MKKNVINVRVNRLANGSFSASASKCDLKSASPGSFIYYGDDWRVGDVAEAFYRAYMKPVAGPITFIISSYDGERIAYDYANADGAELCAKWEAFQKEEKAFLAACREARKTLFEQYKW